MSRQLDRIKALLAELQQAVADFEQGPREKPRKRPLVKVEAQPDEQSVADMTRRLRRMGVR